VKVLGKIDSFNMLKECKDKISPGSNFIHSSSIYICWS